MTSIQIVVMSGSADFCGLLAEGLNRDSECQVVSEVSNQRLALEEIRLRNPDLVILDLDPPDLDGLDLLKEIRKRNPSLPVIVLGPFSRTGTVSALDALAEGASDFLAKPGSSNSHSELARLLVSELIPRIKQHCRDLLTVRHGASEGPTAFAQRLASQPIARTGMVPRIDIVAVGVSTGGPNALVKLFTGFPEGFSVPILIVQHMPPMFTRMLAERLDQLGGLRFHEGEEGMPVRPGNAYLAPGGRHMEIRRCGWNTVIHIHEGPPENSCRPAADVLFRSVMEIYGGNVLGIILTGMGQDGLRACRLLREKNGQILVQDKLSSVVWGMPGYVARAGLADGILPINAIAAEMVRRVQQGPIAGRHSVVSS